MAKLEAPDPRICKYCHGMNFVYIETPEVRPLGHTLKPCPYKAQHRLIELTGADVRRMRA